MVNFFSGMGVIADVDGIDIALGSTVVDAPLIEEALPGDERCGSFLSVPIDCPPP